jgi:hypothetical protein
MNYKSKFFELHQTIPFSVTELGLFCVLEYLARRGIVYQTFTEITSLSNISMPTFEKCMGAFQARGVLRLESGAIMLFDSKQQESNKHTFSLRDGTIWYLPDELHAVLKDEYHGIVNLEEELTKARMWLLANPAKRKTARGITRFITNWMNRQVSRAISTSARKKREVQYE